MKIYLTRFFHIETIFYFIFLIMCNENMNEIHEKNASFNHPHNGYKKKK